MRLKSVEDVAPSLPQTGGRAALRGIADSVGAALAIACRAYASDRTAARFGANTGHMLRAAGAMGVAFGTAGLARSVGQSVRQFEEARKVQAQTQAALRSTGGASFYHRLRQTFGRLAF